MKSRPHHCLRFCRAPGHSSVAECLHSALKYIALWILNVLLPQPREAKTGGGDTTLAWWIFVNGKKSIGQRADTSELFPNPPWASKSKWPNPHHDYIIIHYTNTLHTSPLLVTHQGNGKGRNGVRPMGTAAYGGKGSKGRVANGDRPVGAASCRRDHHTMASCQNPLLVPTRHKED